jgi:hypothetical protein
MFIVPSTTFRLFVMLILAHDRRKIVRFDVTQHPTAGWLSRQVTEAFPCDTAPRFLLRDRDASYGALFRRRVEAMDITEIITAPRSPGRIHTSRGSSARSGGSVSTTSSSSTSAIFAVCPRSISTITTAGSIYRSTRIVRTRVLSSRRRAAQSSPSGKSADCTIATSASRPDDINYCFLSVALLPVPHWVRIRRLQQTKS